MKIACIIPARLKSTRFPKKMLSYLGPKPLLQWVWEKAKACKQFDEVLFAIDDQKIGDLIETFGGQYKMTSVDCTCGTDRLVELMVNREVKADIWVNWQGDEPFIKEKMIADLLQSIDDHSDVWTLKKKIYKADSPHIVKVVCDQEGKALYFSRSQLPFALDTDKTIFYKHIGLYAYKNEALRKIQTLKPTPLEKAEKLEQLRFLENGMTIRVHETTYETLGIDLPEHLKEAEKLLHN